MQNLITLLFWSAVSAQTSYDTTDGELSPIKVQWTYKLSSEEHGKNFEAHLRNWHVYFKDQGLYESGVVMNTFGWLDQTTVKQTILFTNQDAQKLYLDACFDNDDLVNADDMFSSSGQLLSQYGSITGDTIVSSDVDAWWPGYISDSAIVNIDDSGPLVQGWLNS